MHSSDTLSPPESHQSGQDHDSGRRDRSSTSRKHPRRRFLLGGAAVLGLAATGTSAWALNRFVIEHVEVDDVTALEAAGTELRASKLVLSGSWSTTVGVAAGGNAPIIAVRPGIAEVAAVEGAPLAAEALEVPVSAEAAAVRLVSREATSVASGPALSEARTTLEQRFRWPEPPT